MANIFFTADQHWAHPAIIDHCNRPYATVEEMDAWMVIKWNAKVGPEDTVWHLGDFAWHNPTEYIRQLHGHIHLITGNHDHKYKDALLQTLFVDVRDIMYLKQTTPHLVLCHYPMVTWPGMYRGAVMLHGHCHGNLEPWRIEHMPRACLFDVGVDCWNFEPVAWEELLVAIRRRKDPVPAHFFGETT